MINVNMKLYFSKLLIYLFFICVNFTFILKVANISTFPGIISICIIPFLLLNYRNVGYLYIFLIIWLLCLIAFNSYGISTILFYILGAYSMRFYPFRLILKANLLSQIGMFIIMPILLQYGVIHDAPIIKNFNIAHDFGYGNSNTFAEYIIYLIVTVYLLYMNRQQNYLLLLFIISIAIIGYLLSLSRSLILVSSILAFSIIIPMKKIYLNIITSKIFNIILISIIPLSILFLLFTSNIESFNEFTSNRSFYMIEMMNKFTQKTLITGMDVPEDIIIDNVYMLTTLYGGIITLIFIVYKNFSIMTKKEYSYKYINVLFAFFLYGLIESCYLNPFISGTYIIWILLIGNKSIEKKRNYESSSSLCYI